MPSVKKCPDCAERVLDEASVCRHCGHTFAAEDSVASGYRPPAWAVVLVVAILTLGAGGIIYQRTRPVKHPSPEKCAQLYRDGAANPANQPMDITEQQFVDTCVQGKDFPN